MEICVIGSGYVGLVASVCFSDMCHHVICVDKIGERINKLNEGVSPFYEPYLESMMERCVKNQYLKFTTNLISSVRESEVIIMAVGTPQDSDGSADVSAVMEVFHQINDDAPNWSSSKILALKSTVPVGTGNKLQSLAHDNLYVINIPEFLREGQAIYDFQNPDRVIVGCDDTNRIKESIEKLYDHATDRIKYVSRSSAELIKYGSNCMLAMRIAFINEIAAVAGQVGADIDDIADGIGSDTRIGPSFLRAGPGFGGSCFGKDLKAFSNTAKSLGCNSYLANATIESNEVSILRVIPEITAASYDRKIAKIAVLGLSFKPNTDDVRDSPSLFIIPNLVSIGYELSCHDPMATQNFQTSCYMKSGYTLHTDIKEALSGADAVLLLTDWTQYISLTSKELLDMSGKSEMVVFDTRRVMIRSNGPGIVYKAFGISK